MIPGYSRENFRGSNCFQLTGGDGGLEESTDIHWFMRELIFALEWEGKRRYLSDDSSGAWVSGTDTRDQRNYDLY